MIFTHIFYHGWMMEAAAWRKHRKCLRWSMIREFGRLWRALISTDTLLLEMPFSQWDKEVYREVRKIIEHRRIKVILAHVERYSSYQKNKDIWEEILDLPLTIQLNAGEILQFGKKKLCRELLNSGIPVLLGSDCHNTGKRAPNMLKGKKAVENLAGAGKTEEIDRLGEQVLNI